MSNSSDFKQSLVSHATVALDRAGRATSEAATNQYLILPFLQLLGYDPLDPDEIVPEAHASFSEKFKNRVDFAICKDGKPVIAVESKKVGSLGESHRGEIKGYFNAVTTVKLGILTDGLIWEMFTDTAAENVMDDAPFARIDLADVARNQINETAFDALLRLRKGTFDPADVGSDAKRKMYTSAYVQALEEAFRNPGEVMVKAMMDLVGIEGRRTSRLVEEHTPMVADALSAFIDRKLLERVGFAARQDLVRVAAPVAPPDAAAPEPTAEAASEAEPSNGVITTDTEIAVYDYVRQRLAFLVGGDEGLYASLQHLHPYDYKTTFSVCYKQERKGKLFNFRETLSGGPRYRFDFIASGESIVTDTFGDIDAPLQSAYRQRVAELG